MKARLMRNMDWYLGLPICYMLAMVVTVRRFFGRKPIVGEVRKILVMKFFGIGSVVLTVPTVEALRDKFPGAKVAYLSFASNKGILDLLGTTDANYLIDTKSFGSLIASSWKTIISLRKEKIDLVLDLEFFAKFPIAFAYIIGAKEKAGFYLTLESWRQTLLDHRGNYNHYYHVKDIFLSLVYLVKERDPYYLHFEAYTKSFQLKQLPVNGAEKAEALKKLHALGLPEGKKVLVVNANAGSDLAPAAKRWPARNFALLAERVHATYGDTVRLVFTGSPDEKRYVEDIVGMMSKSAQSISHVVAGAYTLRELVHLFSIADLFVTIDSGPMHLASMSEVKMIALFFAETPVLFGPLSPHARVLYPRLYCLPLFTVYTGKELMVEGATATYTVSPDDVLQEITTMMSPVLPIQ